MNALAIDYADRLHATLREFFSGQLWEIVPLKGDGSSRRYAKLQRDKSTMVAMILPGEQSGQSEEAGATQVAAELPFLNIARYLQRQNLPVPNVFGFSATHGILLLEDLGQRHLADEFAAGVPEARYRQALALLAKFQNLRGTAELCVLFGRRYDFDLWNWEFDHFREYGVEVRSGRALDPESRRQLDQAFASLAKQIAANPDVPVHRDYHCRNLMIDGANELRWIDFQDALMGPALYDVASLLYDAYVDIPQSTRHRLFDNYVEQAEKRGIVLPANAIVMLDLVAVHRMLKAAGRFIFFKVKKNLDGYTEHIPGLLARVKTIVEARRQMLPELGVIYDLQRPLVPEWR